MLKQSPTLPVVGAIALSYPCPPLHLLGLGNLKP